MKRRSFLKLTGLGSAVLISSRRLFANQSPNLLIIHTDEHNFRTLGCYRDTLPKEQALMWGEDVVETPNIDWLAKNGALCTGFYATTPVCSPSRAAFISGQYPQNTPVTTNNIPLSDDVISFAEILKRNAYKTGYAGKWHLNGTGKPQWKPDRQFGFEDNRYMFNRGHWKKLEITADGPRVAARTKKGKKGRKGKKAETGAWPSYSVDGADEKSFTTDFLADRAIEFIEQNQSKPFCYMVSIPDPHGPDTVRKPYDIMYSNIKFKLPRTFNKPDKNLPGWGEKKIKNAGRIAKGIKKYYGMVKCIDDNTGKILESLRKLNLMENTIIVFTSDHGDLYGEHGRNNKGVPFEASAKIPFIIYYPDKIKAGLIIKETLGCVDFLPTILNIMGFKTAGKEEGRDASELFTTGKAPSSWKDITFIRGTWSNPKARWIAAVTKQYKVVYAPNENPWLFDNKADIDEIKNFYKDKKYRKVIRNLSKEILAYGKKYKDPAIENESISSSLESAAEEGEIK